MLGEARCFLARVETPGVRKAQGRGTLRSQEKGKLYGGQTTGLAQPALPDSKERKGDESDA